MFIVTKRSGHTRVGAQFAQGYFLILAQPEIPMFDTEGNYIPHDKQIAWPIHGIVRYVSMSQYGHWIMGRLRHKDAKDGCISLSGSYGSDGLICTVPMALYEVGTPLPQDLYEAWNKGNGWNSAGSEASAMRVWGLSLLSERQRRIIKSWRVVANGIWY
jgi:hypothetical protein